MDFVETSAKDGTSVDDMFARLVSQMQGQARELPPEPQDSRETQRTSRRSQLVESVKRRLRSFGRLRGLLGMVI